MRATQLLITFHKLIALYGVIVHHRLHYLAADLNIKRSYNRRVIPTQIRYISYPLYPELEYPSEIGHTQVIIKTPFYSTNDRIKILKDR